MTHPKVVSLKREQNKAVSLPPIVNSLRQQSRRQLVELAKRLFNSTDDALFELADRSRSDNDHEIYFDAMRQIRLHRETIETHFISEIGEHFENAFKPEADPIVADDIDVNDIELVQNDDLEVSVAISGIVSKITSQFSIPIMELTRRLDFLAVHGTINERQNPLGPLRVSEAFANAIECLDIDIKVRIILLKLFERLVMQQFGPVYDHANRILAQAGVLTDIKRAMARNRPAPQRPAGSAEPVDARADGTPAGALAPAGASAPAAASAHSGVAAHSGVQAHPGAPVHSGAAGYGVPGAHGYPQTHGSFADGASGGGTTYAPLPGVSSGWSGFGSIQQLLAGARGSGASDPQFDGAVMATPQLLSVLNAVQAESRNVGLDIDTVPPLLDLRQVVVSRAPDVTGEAMSQLGRADEDVVNFIGMLFDYILNDRNLAIPMKALIARLQIPIVKLAIIDKTFFERSGHPARQFLNELSSAGIGWSSATELKRDAVYNKIESVILRVLNGFSNNPSIFEELLEELRAFRSKDSARAERIEARVKEQEAGKSHTLLAKQEVQKVINQKACGLRLPRQLGQYLSDVWSRVLVYTTLKQGADSVVWERLIQTLDELLWSLQPLDNLDQIEQREAAQPELLERLGEGMALIQLTEQEQQRWLDEIREHLDEIARNDRAFLDDDTPRATDGFDTMEEIILAPPREVGEDFSGEAPEPAFLEKISRLTEGAWVEMHQDGNVIRCKLATIAKPGERYIFVNRRGMKVAEKTRMALARDLQDETLQVLNDSQVFDRALQAVIGNLRQVQSKADVVTD